MVDTPGRGSSARFWFAIGAVVGGLLSGALLGLVTLTLPAPPYEWAVAAILTVTALVAVNDGGLARIPFPQNARQVRQSVVREYPSVGAVMFGFEIGTGARTFMTGAAPYIAVAAVVLAAPKSMMPGLLAGVGFGLGRGLVPVDRAFHRAGSRWDATVRRLGGRALPFLSTAVTASLAVALAHR